MVVRCELNCRKSEARARIIRVGGEDLLENSNGFVGLFQAQETGTVFLLRFGLSTDELFTFLKLTDSVFALALLIGERPKHGMAGLVRWPQLGNALQQRDSLLISGLVLNLRSALESRQIIRRKVESMMIGVERFFYLLLRKKRNALQSPELRIVGSRREALICKLQSLTQITSAER